jgi:hypothetical protein
MFEVSGVCRGYGVQVEVYTLRWKVDMSKLEVMKSRRVQIQVSI